MHCGNIVLAHSSSSSCSRPAVRRYNLRPREPNSAIKGVASCTYNLRPRPAKSAIKMSGDRAHWPSENVKMLLDICLAEKEKCNMTSTGLLTPAGWKNVEAAVKEIGYTKRQAQNKLQSLKDKFDGWKSLQKSTGLGHNPQTGAVVAEDDWFASQEADTDGTQLDTQPQESGRRRKSRGTPPPFLDELFALWGSQSKNRGTFMGAGGIDDPTLTPPRMSPELHGTSSVGTSSKRSERDQDVTSPAKKKPSNLTEFMQTISDSIHERSSRSQRRRRERDEQEEVVQMLREDGVEEGSNLYFMALDLFRNPACREQYKLTREPANCIKYIEWTWHQNNRTGNH